MSESPIVVNPYHKMIEKAFTDAIPLSCQFEITYRCNHLCTFCYNSPTGERELSTGQIFEALRKIADFGLLYVTLTGGEAMCHKDFFEIAAEVRRLGMALRIYTNGYLLADVEKVRRIKEFTPMEVEISIHGARPESHDALTHIKGSFAKTWQAIDHLSAEGLKVNLKCPITRLNQDELFEIRELADQRGMSLTYDAVITPKDDGDQNPLALRPDPEYLEKYWGEWYPALHGGKLPPRSNHCAGDKNSNCGTGRSGFTLDPYGNIYPCIALRRKVANILEIESLEEIWRSSSVLHDVRELAVEARDRLDQHDSGPYFVYCPGVAEVQTGDPLGMYPQAEQNARAVRRHYELLQIGEPDAEVNSA